MNDFDGKDVQRSPKKNISRAKWTPEDSAELKHLAKSIIDCGAVSKRRTDACLKDSYLLKKFSFTQIRTKLSYLKSCK